MSGSNPRKFKDRIALMKQREDESTAQFQAVMRDVSEVMTKPKPFPGNFDGGGGGFGGQIVGHHQMGHGHLAPGSPNHHPHFRYGGSLPDVNQMTSGGRMVVAGGGGVMEVPPSSCPASNNNQDMQFAMTMSGMPQMPQSVPLDPVPYSDSPPGLSRAPERSRGVGVGGSGANTSGGGAIRTRSGERRQWDSSPYSDRNYYSSSLVSSYLSPPPESRWRRTSSDSALYQKLNNPSSSATPPSQPATPTSANNHSCSSGQGSPEYCSAGGETDVKPPPELLRSLLRDDQQLQSVKEESGGHGVISVNGDQTGHYPASVNSRLTSPGPLSSPVSPIYSPHTPTFLPHQQNNLEEKFQKFRLDCPPQPQFQDSGGNYLHHNTGTGGATPTTGPTSPHTPSTLPDIYIQDWSQDCEKSLDADFAELREGLEPIDDQLLATLTNSATFVDPAVEEQFKMNY